MIEILQSGIFETTKIEILSIRNFHIKVFRKENNMNFALKFNKKEKYKNFANADGGWDFFGWELPESGLSGIEKRKLWW